MVKVKTIDEFTGQPEGSFAKSLVIDEIRELTPRTSLETQNELVNLWLSKDKNEAQLILEAFKIGVNEGKRQAKGK